MHGHAGAVLRDGFMDSSQVRGRMGFVPCVAMYIPSRMLVVEIYVSPLSLSISPERGHVALCEPVGARDCLECGRMMS